jgi:hypothetical protein
VFVLALAACASKPPKPPATQAPAAPATTTPSGAPAGAHIYTIDANRSQLTMLVHRAGALGKLGHNHVIRSDVETGRAWIAADGRSAGLELHLPVRSFVVDDPAARATAGPDFSAEVPDDARSGTFNNMTGEHVLDAAQFPEIVVQYAGDVPSRESTPVRVLVTLKGQQHPLDVPMVVTVSDEQVAAAGETRLKQSELGLEPFSILGGAIAVADEITVRFEIVATRR